MMAFPEGKSGMRITGAKKVRLIGDDEPDQPAVVDDDLMAYADEPSFGRKAAHEPVPRGSYLKAEKPSATDHTIKPDAVKQRNDLEAGKRPERRGGMAMLQSTNAFGLASRSESLFPEAYRPILTKHWEHASDKEYKEIIRRQAGINKLVTFRDSAFLPVALTAVEEAYEEAAGRRNQAMRRKRKPRNFEERQKWEEDQRKVPLTRRYVSRDPRLETSSFVQTGALQTAVLVPGFAQALKERPTTTPTRLRRRPRRTKAAPSVAEKPKPVPKLPTFDGEKGPKVKLRSYNNAFGLVSRSVTAYPEAFNDVAGVYWKGLTPGERQDIAKVQASAMEKVGFEPKTQKQFIDDFDPMQENRYMGQRARPQAQEKAKRRPVSLPFGIILILLGLICMIPALPYGEPVWLLIVAGIIAGTGVVLSLPIRE